ncbi:efflux RND transporter periplasmic adaptor subunit [bacterium]|nr:efflux RND transporter periplasmic adaptor subunit [bacterium]
MRITTGAMPLFLLYLAVIPDCGKSAPDTGSLEGSYTGKGLSVTVQVLERRPVESSFSMNAVLSGIRESSASSSISDMVERIHFSVGDHVEKDQIVISFPTGNPAARYYQARVNVEHMKTTLDRMDSLYHSGGISRQEFENTAALYKVAEANWNAARQMVEVRAPISGTITGINVQQSDNVYPGDVLFTVARTHALKAQLWVPESRIREVRKGAAAEARWNGIVLKGSVSQVDLSLNTRRQAFGVTCIFTNEGHAVPSGINAEITIFSHYGELLAVDRKNLVREGGTYVAYKVVDGTAVKQTVSTGRPIDLKIEILQGLSEGDTIITGGLTLVEDGQPVRIVK